MITGYGDYKESWLPASLRRAGAWAGGALGAAAGRGIKALTGFGAYTIRKNTMLGHVLQGQPMPIVNPSRGGVVIQHREYLGDVISHATPTQLKVQGYRINPGSRASFPWGFGTAANFQQWVPEGIIFEFISMSGAVISGTNPALGQIIMATQYDVPREGSDFVPPTSTAELLGFEYSISGTPSANMAHPVECDRSQTPLTVLDITGPGDSAEELGKFNDLGIFMIASQGIQGPSANLGQLWVTYQFSLLKPKLNAALLKDQVYTRFFNDTASGDSTHPLGTGVTAANLVHNSAAMSISSATAFRFATLPYPQKYYLSAKWIGTEVAGNSTAPTLTGSAGCTVAFTRLPAPADGQDASTALQCVTIVDIAANSVAPLLTFGVLGVAVPTSSQVEIYFVGMPVV